MAFIAFIILSSLYARLGRTVKCKMKVFSSLCIHIFLSIFCEKIFFRCLS